ncbi:MAG: Na/Pi cotransporter family protein [Xylanivirga thermophila]|jgi:phosphate:Na+ symporter|uniref:Na/Pi cotransporter family protein n=1 Tax=Xylanivirga thermophila TaxID=2496273 RepID=UPI0039F468B0
MDLKMLIMLAGGLGLFLYGMKMMGDGLEKAAGDKLKRLLEALTTNRIMGVLVGTAVTAIIQSSSAVTVMVIGFVNAGLMTLEQAVGVIMGANIGTTITSQLIAFDLSGAAPVAVFLGVGCIFFSKRKSFKKFGEILAGFGILFMGLDIMSSSMAPLGTNEQFRSLMVKFENPILGLLAGMLLTALIQSSSASIGILQALAMQGAITLDSAIFILFGQNIGTCVTALIASIGTTTTAKRAAIMHLLFNVIGTILFTILIVVGVPYVPFIKSLSPNDAVRQFANAHTAFNIINVILLLPLANYLVTLSKKLVPGKESDSEGMHLMYLDERIMETPPIAVAQILKEVGRMGDLARQNVEVAMNAFLNRDENATEDVYRREKLINFLNKEITRYLVMANGLSLQNSDLKLVGSLFHVVNDMERVSDHAENLAEYTEYIVENNISFSPAAIEEMQDINIKVINMLEDSIEAVKKRDKVLAAKVQPQERKVDELEELLRQSHIDRLNKGECTVNSGVVFLDVVTNLERIGDHASNLAYSVIDN